SVSPLSLHDALPISVDFLKMTLEEALRGVAEFPVVRRDVFLELPESGVPALACLRQQLEDFLLRGWLGVLGGPLRADGSTKSLIAGHNSQVHQLERGGHDQNQIEDGLRAAQKESRQHRHDQKGQIDR